MGLVDPRFDFSFDVLAKGLHIVEVKEANIEPAKEGKESGKRYWVRLVAVGGDQEGVSHMESFFEKTKNDFSFSKMAGFLYKLGVIKALGKVDTALFLTPDFENRWKNGMIGKRMGIKIKHGFADDDKAKENPRSESQAYLSYEEATTKAGKGTSEVPKAPETPAAPAASPAPWA